MVDILLASYNGCKYIREQIESLKKQSFNDWHLIVHDDGSTDDTVSIISKIASEDTRIQIVNDGVRIGNPGGNFLHCLKYSSAPFVMFCDQDDIWLPNKIEYHLQRISSKNQTLPQVVYSQSSVWEPERGIIGNTTLYFADHIKSVLFQNGGVQGCAAIFNARARELMMRWNGPVSMHDHLLQLICASMGEIDHIDEPLMLYRRHSGAVTGATKTRQLDLETLRSKIPVVDRRHYDTVKHFYELYNNELPDKIKHYFVAYLQMPELTSFARLHSVVRNGFQLNDSTIMLLIKILLRKYIS